MPALNAHIYIAEDGSLTGRVPAGTPAGEHDAVITIVRKPTRRIADLPAHLGPWDDSISLRREDMYGDDGR